MARLAEACECLLAVFEVKKTAANLQKLGFPPDSDKKALETVLEEQMPNYNSRKASWSLSLFLS